MKRICENVFQVAGDGLTGNGDAMGYLVVAESPVLIDAGCTPESGAMILDHAAQAGVEPSSITHLLLTHCHVDHIGGASTILDKTSAKLVCHRDDAEAIQTGNPVRTASDWYGIRLPKLNTDLVLEGTSGNVAGIQWMHTPGHTPGSLAFTFKTERELILFGQDIHGPFHAEFGSDKNLWAESMRRLLKLDADILCEGHYGIYTGKKRVAEFIESHLKAQGFKIPGL
jgi:glyoxylase-like metal-dependent hydrolase (beta-lactamase superfamily II)